MATNQQVRSAIARFLRVEEAQVVEETILRDLVLESFVLVELVMELQEEFKARLTGEDLALIRTAGQLAALVASRAGA